MAVEIPVAVTTDACADSSDTSLSVPAPSGIQDGDLLIQIGACVDARTLSSSLTQVLLHNINGTNFYVWAKVASSESGNYGITVSGTFSGATAAMFRVTGALSETIPDDISATGGGNGDNDQTAECPNVTTPVDNCMVLWLEIAGNGQTSNSNSRGSAVEVLDYNGNGDGGHLGGWSETIASAGSVTGAIITRSGFGAATTIGIVLQPSEGGGGEGPSAAVVSMANALFSVILARRRRDR